MFFSHFAPNAIAGSVLETKMEHVSSLGWMRNLPIPAKESNIKQPKIKQQKSRQQQQKMFVFAGHPSLTT